MKKITAALAAILIVLSLFSLCSFAAEEPSVSEEVSREPIVYNAAQVWRTGLLSKWTDGADNVKRMTLFAVGSVLCAVIAYLLGSINPAIIVSKKLFGKDIRKYGSGNAGMTNMFRVFGKKAGVLTLVGDISKTFVSVMLARAFLGEHGAYLAGMFCLLGHIAPIYYHFKGGKGVIVSAVTILIIDPVIFAAVFAVFVLVFLIWRYVSLASVLAAFAYPAAVYISAYIRSGGKAMPMMSSIAFAFFVGIFVIFMHRENLKRIYNGTESKVYFKKKKEPEEGEEEKKPVVRHTGGGKRSKNIKKK